jgi:two-component system CheB/CheR fusion protein
LKAIKEHGGITFAQDQHTAAFDSMPQSAINADAVDFVLPPEKIPKHLLEIDKLYESIHAHGDPEHEQNNDDHAFRQILILLRLRTGNDFSHYKPATIRRRISRRMLLNNKEILSDYLNMLRTNRIELDALFNDILIPVSYFFRDQKTFELLAEDILPALVSAKQPTDTIRLWVAGCSTGEEAYSYAICLHEYLVIHAPAMKVQIFASDISENTISKARAAIYSKQDVQNISEDRLSRYFKKSDGEYHICKPIRDMVVFAVHNFLKDPPFAKMDLISCRNVLIYLDAFLQKKALSTFHYALNESGVLVLGKSETTGHMPTLFKHLVKQDKIYTRKSVAAQFTPSVQEPNVLLPRGNAIKTMDAAVAKPDFRKSAF